MIRLGMPVKLPFFITRLLACTSSDFFHCTLRPVACVILKRVGQLLQGFKVQLLQIRYAT